jgi:hypothetical protein
VALLCPHPAFGNYSPQAATRRIKIASCSLGFALYSAAWRGIQGLHVAFQNRLRDTLPSVEQNSTAFSERAPTALGDLDGTLQNHGPALAMR